MKTRPLSLGQKTLQHLGILMLSLATLNVSGADNTVRPGRSFSSDSEAWAARVVTERQSALPQRVRRQAATQRPLPAQDAIPSLLERWTPFPAQAGRSTRPTQLAAETDNEVWSVTLGETGQTVRHEFAAHLRPDDSRPLYWRATGLPARAGATFEQASRLVVDKVLGGQTAQRKVLGWATPATAAELKVRTIRGALLPPWEKGWFFFVDDAPGKNWEHPCRYVYVAEDLSAFAVQYGRMPVTVEAQQNGQYVEQDLKVVIESTPETQAAQAPAQAATKTAGSKSLDYSGSAANCYAVIISGGIEARQNYIRYWGDDAFIYSTLTKKYGYDSSHIYTLISDGGAAANDRNNADYDHPSYSNSPADLDGDGVDDTDFSCTKANIQSVFNTLGGILTSNDQLFVFVTDHGGQESGWNAVIWLWGGDTLRDDELADMTADLPCPVMVAMETCYSGGFVDDMNQPNTVIGTACTYDDTSVAGDPWPTYDQWAYHFTAALRGFYPGANPWDDGAACDADSNGDGRVSFKEACDYAYAHRNASDVPQYGENPAGLGSSLYMNQSHIDLPNALPYIGMFPRDYSFEVKSYDWAIVGIAPTVDYDLKTDEDRHFSSPYRYSSESGAARDFIVVNGHEYGNGRHYARVYFGTFGLYFIEAQWEATDLFLSTSHSATMGAAEVNHLYEIYLSAGQQVDLTLNTTSGSGDLGVYVFKPSRTSGSRSYYDWRANAAGGGGDESLSFTATVSGYYAIAVINENGASANYTILAAPPPPLAAPTGVAASDGSYTDRIVITWNTVSGASYYEVFRSTENNTNTATAITDWQAGTSHTDTNVSAGQLYYYWVKAASSNTGNRESNFSSVNSGYVAPLTLTTDVKVNTTTDPAYYQFRDANSKWWAVGVRYNDTGENWSLRVYSGPDFGTLLASSQWNTPVDFVVGDGHHVAYQYRGAEAFRVGGTGYASVEFEGGSQTMAVGTNSAAWPAGDVVKMWDVSLSAGTYRFDLNFTAGTADLGMAVYGSGDGAYYRSRQFYLANSDKTGGAVNESFMVTVTNSDYYGLCVWGNDANAANFNMVITPLQAGLWEGDISANWHTPGNWNDGKVPTSLVDVVIPAGTPNSPAITAGAGYCRSINIDPRATLTIGPTNLYVAGNVVSFGTLSMNNTASRLYVTNDVYWEAGATVNQIGSARMIIWGDWNFEAGANVHLTTGFTEFTGTGVSWIRSYEASCNLFNLNCSKTGGGYVAVSPVCVDELHINNLYNYSESMFRDYSDYPVVISGFFNNMGGHFECYRGSVVFSGAGGLVSLKPNTGDFFRDLVINTSSTMTLDNSYTNTLQVRGNLSILSASLSANGLNVVVGGNWSNTVGSTGFQAGPGTVTFTGGGADQTVYGATIFNNLKDARSGAGTLNLLSPLTVVSNYTANASNAVYDTLLVQRLLDVSKPGCSFTLKSGSSVTASNLTMGGALVGEGGDMTVGDLVNNGLYGDIVLQSGNISLRQGTAIGEYVDLNGNLTINGGQLQVSGGQGTSFWPWSADASLIMRGGILDFKDQGIRVYTNASHSFTQYVSSGVIRTARSMSIDRTDFKLAGGTIEFQGATSAEFYMKPGSYCHDILINKSRSTITGTSDLDIRGGFSLARGAFVAPTNMLVWGSWSNGVSPAAFDEGTGSVTFTGSVAAVILTDETFHNLIVNKQTPHIILRSTYELQLEASRSVQVRNNLSIQDGCLAMMSLSSIEVDTNFFLANGAGLNAVGKGTTISMGGNWQNANTNYSTRYGFNPGFSSTVVFNGAVNGTMTTAADQERFYNLRIDRTGGSFRPADSVAVVGAMNLDNGYWSYSASGLTHYFRGNVRIAEGGSWADHTAGSAIRFDGYAEQTLEDLSTNGYFGNFIVDKNPVDPALAVAPLRLLSRVLCLGGTSLTVEKGYFDLNGNLFRCTGNVTVNNQGQLDVDAGAQLEVGSGYSLTVNTGAVLVVQGTLAQPALITHHSGYYNINIERGATIRADYGSFQYMSAAGVYVKDGATVDPDHAFNYCGFSLGPAGGTLLRVETAQKLIVNGARFPLNPGGAGAANVRKELNQGLLTFSAATGAFAGENYDYDPYDRIDWASGSLTGVKIAGPAQATKGVSYNFISTVTGDTPLCPIAYYYTVTDHGSIQNPAGGLKDTLGLSWDVSGTKTVRVVASNSLGQASSQISLKVLDLSISRITRGQTGGSNWVALTLSGTTTGLVYGVQWVTEVTNTSWQLAAPDGVSIPGQATETPWVDWGNTNRDLNTISNLFYRAVVK